MITDLPFGHALRAEDAKEVERFIARVDYKPGWRLWVRNESLHITLTTTNSETGVQATFTHVCRVPWGVAHHPGGIQRWVFDRITDVERHEAMEFFLVDGAAPYFPQHGGNDAYKVVERAEPYLVNRPKSASHEDALRFRPLYGP